MINEKQTTPAEKRRREKTWSWLGFEDKNELIDINSELISINCAPNETWQEAINLLDKTYENIIVKIKVGENAKLELLIITNDHETDNIFLEIIVEKDGSANIGTSHLGSGGQFSYIGKLQGEKASLVIKNNYILWNDFLDIKAKIIHEAPKTSSQINTWGIMGERAKKKWQAILEFPRGCMESRGEERETVLTLGGNMDNRSLPIILADEEAIEAIHAVTSGGLAEIATQYAATRGIEERELWQLIAKSKMKTMIAQIKDENEREKVYKIIEQSIEKL